jgi:hypothetical protein
MDVEDLAKVAKDLANKNKMVRRKVLEQLASLASETSLTAETSLASEASPAAENRASLTAEASPATENKTSLTTEASVTSQYDEREMYELVWRPVLGRLTDDNERNRELAARIFNQLFGRRWRPPEADRESFFVDLLHVLSVRSDVTPKN